jgi:hypothetical protein
VYERRPVSKSGARQTGMARQHKQSRQTKGERRKGGGKSKTVTPFVRPTVQKATQLLLARAFRASAAPLPDHPGFSYVIWGEGGDHAPESRGEINC